MNTKNLTTEAPASPRTRVGGYVILARTADKGRADLAGKIGDYHYNCPLDNFFFGFKGIDGDGFKAQLSAGADNEAVAKWVDSSGTPKTPAEIKEWSDGLEAYRPYDDPEKKDWFVEQCATVNIDPTKSTIFDFLEADDKASFAK
ncbi:MAG: DUF5069 domain-containing protein [Chthoniobacterales bacterium]